MKRFKTFIKTYDVPLYGSKFTVVVYKNVKTANRLLQMEGFLSRILDDEDGFCTVETFDYGRNHLIGLKYKDNPIHLEGSFIHELYHSIQDILEYRNIDYIKGDPNEPWAYLIESLYMSIITDIRQIE